MGIPNATETIHRYLELGYLLIDPNGCFQVTERGYSAMGMGFESWLRTGRQGHPPELIELLDIAGSDVDGMEVAYNARYHHKGGYDYWARLRLKILKQLSDADKRILGIPAKKIVTLPSWYPALLAESLKMADDKNNHFKDESWGRTVMEVSK